MNHICELTVVTNVEKHYKIIGLRFMFRSKEDLPDAVPKHYVVFYSICIMSCSVVMVTGEIMESFKGFKSLSLNQSLVLVGVSTVSVALALVLCFKVNR